MSLETRLDERIKRFGINGPTSGRQLILQTVTRRCFFIEFSFRSVSTLF
jgi:hypothetical protein